MNKLLTKIVGIALGATMAIGVGVAISSANKEVTPAFADITATLTFADLDEYSNGVTLKDAFDPDEIPFGTYFILTFGKGNAGTDPTFYTASNGVTAYGPKNGNGNFFTVTTSTANLYITKMTMGGSSKQGSPIWSFNKGTTTSNYTTISQATKAQSVTGTLTGNNSSASKAPQWKLTTVSIEYVILTPTVSSVTLSPSTDVTLKKGEEQEFEVGISGSNLTGNETVSVSYEEVIGSAADISIDTASGLKNGDTFTVTAVNGGAAGEITATYGTGVNAVSSDPVVIYTEEPKTLKSLAITNGGTAKTSYVVGEAFNPSGLTVTATFEDNSQEDVTSKVTWSPLTIAANTEEVVASYTEVVEKTASFAISVEADYITNVVFNTSNAKTKYSLGDSFIASETGVTAVTKYVVAADGALTAGQLTYSGYDLNTDGEQTVTVSYPNPKSATPFSTTYSINVTKVVVSSVEDSITVSDTGVSGTSYIDMTPFSKSSPAVYDGACAGGDSNNPNTIQIRSKNSDSGLIVTTSGGYVKKITMSLVSGNGVDVYAKTSAYEAATDLFDSTAKGTEIATSVTPDANGNAVVEFTANTYTYFGIRSHSGASYISSLKVLWESSEAADADVTSINNFIRDYMHLDYTKSEGYCNDASNHWYSTAKSEFASLSTNAKLILATSTTNYKTVTLDANHKNNDDPDTITYKYSDVKARFIAWAEIVGETIEFSTSTGAIVQSARASIGKQLNNSSTATTIVIILSFISLTAVGGYFFLRKRKEVK